MIRNDLQLVFLRYELSDKVILGCHVRYEAKQSFELRNTISLCCLHNRMKTSILARLPRLRF